MLQSRGERCSRHLTSRCPIYASERLLTLHETAELLRVSTGDLLDAVVAGLIPTVSIDGEALIFQEEFWPRLSAYQARPDVDAAAGAIETEHQRGCGCEGSRSAANEVLSDLLAASARDGVTLKQFGSAVTLARGCLTAVASVAGPQRPGGDG